MTQNTEQENLDAGVEIGTGLPQPEVSGEQLEQYVGKIEEFNEQRNAIGRDIRDVYQEAKANGYNVKVLRAIVRLRKVSKAERQEEDELLNLYKSAIGLD
jgi:uncharacterized protein (UPF0335 family)